VGTGLKGTNELSEINCCSGQGSHAKVALEVTRRSVAAKINPADSLEPLEQIELARCWQIEGGGTHRGSVGQVES